MLSAFLYTRWELPVAPPPPPEQAAQFRLSSGEESSLLKLARQTLKVCATSESCDPVLESFKKSPQSLEPQLLENLACFVTLTQKNGRLRGCVGCLEGYQSLYKNVFQFTQKAALEDPRFDAVTPNEVPKLVISISVLGPMQPLPDINLLELGKQGLYVHHQKNHGVLLAKVATEWGWDQKEYAMRTCEKAGLAPERWKQYEFFYFDEVSFSERGEEK